MDNITHSLIGIVLGEAIYRAQPVRSRETPLQDAALRAGILWTSVLANNLPDADIFLKPFVSGGSLGMLLHHRGYTHTLALSLPLALIAAAMGRLTAKRVLRNSPVSPAPSWRLLIMVGLLGLLCHISADFWNDYGIHPFWPLTNRWFYGDFIFILEPLLWLVMLPFAYSVTRSKFARSALGLLSMLMIAAVWYLREMAPVAVAVWITLWALVWFTVQLRILPRSLWAAVGGMLWVLVVFASASQTVRSQIAAQVPSGETLLQLSSTPAPANPFCWKVIMATREEDIYRTRVAVVTLGQGWIQGGFNRWDQCAPKALSHSAPLQTVVTPSLVASGNKAIHWVGEFQGSLKELATLKGARCRFRALLRFVRIPFWASLPGDGDVIRLGDLRYDSGTRMGFAEIYSRPEDSCADQFPEWDDPSGL